MQTVKKMAVTEIIEKLKTILPGIEDASPENVSRVTVDEQTYGTHYSLTVGRGDKLVSLSFYVAKT
jgi:hypothetical protein